MSTIRSVTPQIDQEKDVSIKVQVWVSQRDKRTILSAVGDDGVFTFVIRTAFKRLADFVTTNDIKSYDPTSFNRFVDFVRNGTDTRPDRVADVVHDARTAKGVQHPDATATGRASSVSKSRPGRSGKQTGKR